ncbi:MAG: ABC transporter ATP-binding protein [Clostridia bacterium]|nr:ABC transporter ATP-binding protein [Clostridia bacterium]
MHKEAIIEVRELGKSFGRLQALKDLSFCIEKGEIFGLVGPNGAGKSTFISILTTLSKPTSGDIYISGYSAAKQPDRIKKLIGYVPQDIALYPTLSGLDNLRFWAGIYGLGGKLKTQRIEEALDIVRLGDRAKDKVENYSGGMKRRLNIAVAILHHPEILVMDEPTVGVDIQSRKYILEAVKNFKSNGKTVVFTSHYTDEMEALCDRLAIIDKGVIKSIGTVNELKSMYGKEKIEDIMLSIMEA